MPSLLNSATLLVGAQGRGLGNTNVSGPGGVAGGNTTASTTIPDPSGFGMWWGVMNSATPAIALPSPSTISFFRLRLDQDATGGRVPSFSTPSGLLLYPSGQLSVITTASSRNFASLYADGTNWFMFPETTNLAFVTSAGALSISGTPTVGQKLTATSATAANWQ